MDSGFLTLEAHLAKHRPTRWRSFSNDNEILRCCGQDFGRLTGKPKRTDPDPYALWAQHVAETYTKANAAEGSTI